MPDDTILIRLTEAVGNYFKDEPQCVSAAAILTAAGRELGFDLQPRPVSIYAAPKSGAGGAIATGDKASGFGERLSMTAAVKSPYLWHSDFDRAGHMIVTADKGNWVLDPTFSQFAYAGLPRTIITTQVPDVHPRLKFIQCGDIDFGVRYWFEDEVVDWRDQYEQYQNENGHLVETITRSVHDGRI